MTQTQPQNEEIEEVAEVQEVESPEVEAPEEPEFDPKQRVEFTTPDQQKKFNDVYKQMRMSDARNKMLMDVNQKALDKIADLESRFQQTDHAEAERILTSRLKEARESGDEDKADKILQEIIDFRVDSKLKSPKSEPIKVKPIDDPDVVEIVNFAKEEDANGNLLRPWISAEHPNHANAMKLAGSLALQVNADLGFVDVGEVMRRMDDAMKAKPRVQTNTRSPDPMRANLTNQSPRGKIKLSPQELAAAEKLGVKPEDYLKWKR